jgi:hypothetical protein
MPFLEAYAIPLLTGSSTDTNASTLLGSKNKKKKKANRKSKGTADSAKSNGTGDSQEGDIEEGEEDDQEHVEVWQPGGFITKHQLLTKAALKSGSLKTTVARRSTFSRSGDPQWHSQWPI